VEINKRVLGADHSETLQSMENLATVYELEGNPAKAEPLFRDALEKSRRVLGREAQITLSFLADSAFLHQRRGDYAGAESIAAAALSGRRRVFGPNNAITMESAADLALAQISAGKFAQGEALAREAFEFHLAKQPDTWRRFWVESLLGASLAGQKNFAQAEPHLIAGVQGMEQRKDQIGVPNLYYLDRAREWVALLHKNGGKAETAAEWGPKFAH
jgi:hypothetical protein